MSKEIICIVCPLGCKMDVQVEGTEVIGVKDNKCKKGEQYARQEVFFPGRILTTTVETGDPEAPLLPVRSDNPILKDELEECMKVIAKHVVTKPLQPGDVVIRNILGLDVDIIACRTLRRNVG